VTYREKLIHYEFYAAEQIQDWSEEDCEAEYIEIVTGGH
jgi:hypothetical protein